MRSKILKGELRVKAFETHCSHFARIGGDLAVETGVLPTWFQDRDTSSSRTFRDGD